MSLVTRYAPSPTGPLHIGGARTALYCWALARRHAGRFLLRFEDTDRARSTRESELAVLEALEWLGIEHDEVPGFAGIPRQSERAARYAGIVGELLERGRAYRCTATPEELEGMREAARAEGRKRVYDGRNRDAGIPADVGAPFCVRLRVPDSGPETRWTDLIAGASGEAPEDIDDFVIARTDGSAVYHLAVVVDDHDMGVTHVVRGREHLSSTPRQLLLYQALGWEPPAFAHVPLLVGASGKKLSKREGDVSVQAYRDRGFPAEAMVNYLARLGWSHGDLEIFERRTLVELFSLEGVGRAPAQVDEAKLAWVSQQHLKRMPAEELAAAVQPFLDAEAGEPVAIGERLRAGLDLLRERSETLADMARQARFLYVDELEYEPKAARKFLKPPAAPLLRDAGAALGGLDSWDRAAIEAALGGVVDAHQVKLGKLAQPLRVAVTGRGASPGIYETLEALGRDRTLARIEAAAARAETVPSD
ncbi:MAG: glutamate--tRNA ligase [Proteobacteria bacterium]|nr:glutamate--tRNA ligase [Pseudomonadota bacterium]